MKDGENLTQGPAKVRATRLVYYIMFAECALNSVLDTANYGASRRAYRSANHGSYSFPYRSRNSFSDFTAYVRACTRTFNGDFYRSAYVFSHI